MPLDWKQSYQPGTEPAPESCAINRDYIKKDMGQKSPASIRHGNDRLQYYFPDEYLTTNGRFVINKTGTWVNYPGVFLSGPEYPGYRSQYTCPVPDGGRTCCSHK